MQRALRLLRLARRDERAGVELLVVPVCPLEPHRELPRHPELVERVAVRPLALVHRRVPRAPEIVEQRPLDRADDALLVQPIDELLLRLVPREQAVLRRRPLREHLPELTQLEQRHRRILREVLLRLRPERGEPRIVMREVREVGRGSRVHREAPRRRTAPRTTSKGTRPGWPPPTFFGSAVVHGDSTSMPPCLGAPGAVSPRKP